MGLRGIEVEVECTGYDEVDAEDVLEKNDPEDVIAYYGADVCLKLILSGKVKPNKREKSFRVEADKDISVEEGTASSIEAIISTIQMQIDPYERKFVLGKPMDAKEKRIYDEMVDALDCLNSAMQHYRNSVTVGLYCTGPVE